LRGYAAERLFGLTAFGFTHPRSDWAEIPNSEF